MRLIGGSNRIAKRGKAGEVAGAERHCGVGAGHWHPVDVDGLADDPGAERGARVEGDGACGLVEKGHAAVGVNGDIVVGAGDDRDAGFITDLTEERVALVERIGDVFAGDGLADEQVVYRRELGEKIVQTADRIHHIRIGLVADGGHRLGCLRQRRDHVLRRGQAGLREVAVAGGVRLRLQRGR